LLDVKGWKQAAIGLLNHYPTRGTYIMDKLVRRVTVVQGAGGNREAKVVYKNDEDDDDYDGMPRSSRLERAMRHMLKAQVIAAQEAYQRHLDSVDKGGSSWMYEAPGNFMKARRKAMKELRKASPFKMMKFEDDDDDEKDGD
jgi:hypothetical protein